MRHDFLLHSLKNGDFGKVTLAISDMQKMPVSLAKLLLKFAQFTDDSVVMSCLTNTTVS